MILCNPLNFPQPATMNNLNSLLNQHQSSSLQDIIHNHCEAQMSSSTHFNPTSDNFLEQMLSSIPSSVSSFPWADDRPPPAMLRHLDEETAAALASKMRQHQIGDGADMMLQHQLLLSRSVAAANGILSPTVADGGLHNDVVDGSSFKSANVANDASIKSLFRGFSTGSVVPTPNQSQHFNHPQAQNFGAGSLAASGGGAAAQPRQRVRARRGQATDPHSIAERLRRERIAERMKGLQELVPNANKTDKASMLDEIIDYVKFLQLQVKVLSMSRLGGAAATVSPLVAHHDSCSEDRRGNGTETASTSQDMTEGMTVAEKQVAKLMEEDMGSAMQYLQSKGLCLMPISLATATCLSARNPLAPGLPAINGPTSPSSISVLTAQSAAVGGDAGGGELTRKDATPFPRRDSALRR